MNAPMGLLAAAAYSARVRARGRLPSGSLGAALGLLLAVACSTPATLLPVAVDRDPIISEALKRTQELYLWPDRLDRRMLIGALDALEARFDPVRFDVEGDRGLLWVGDASAVIPLDPAFESEAFQDTLAAALLFTEKHLPPDPDAADDEPTLQLTAMNGALASLDRYTTIFSGRDTEDFQIRFRGKLRGIGARIGRRDGALTAIKVFEASPAQLGGLVDDDQILQIDDASTKQLSVRDAVGLIRGEEGTLVRLHVRRDEEELDLEITRREVVIPSVEAEDLGDDIGHLRITTVSRQTVPEFRKKLRQFETLEGLVLDLRGNTGGSMLAAAQIADLFLPGDTIVRVVDKNGHPSGGIHRRGTAIASRRVLVNVPVAVLVDAQTASAAEIISGAIAPLDHVTVIGQTTFGKGLIQRVVELPDENLLKLTVGEYLLSNDRAIHEKGVEPDIELYPVSTEDLGRLAALPPKAVPYLVEPDAEANAFPLDFAKQLLRESREAAVRDAHALASERIHAELGEQGVRWTDTAIELEEDEKPLRISGTLGPLFGGQAARVQLEVTNASERTLPDAWLALGGSPEFLRNKVASLGTLEPGTIRKVDFDVLPPDGLSASLIPVSVRVAAGSRAVQDERLELSLDSHAPDIEIVVERLASDDARVSLRNRGCCPPGDVRVIVPGTIEEIEDLAGGTVKSVDIPLGGGTKTISILLLGAGVSQRIDVPVPEASLTVQPPSLIVERVSSLGRSQVRVSAKSAEGLREGWLALDGQKEVYVAWDGARDGALRSGLETGDHDLTTKIETLSGVSIIDTRRLIAN